MEFNTARAQKFCRFAVLQGVIPFAPHLLFTQFLDDNAPKERRLGLDMGMKIMEYCHELWVFGSRISEGMKAEIEAAQRLGRPIYYFNDRCEKLDNKKSPPVLQHQASLNKNTSAKVYQRTHSKERVSEAP